MNEISTFDEVDGWVIQSSSELLDLYRNRSLDVLAASDKIEFLLIEESDDGSSVEIRESAARDTTSELALPCEKSLIDVPKGYKIALCPRLESDEPVHF